MSISVSVFSDRTIFATEHEESLIEQLLAFFPEPICTDFEVTNTRDLHFLADIIDPDPFTVKDPYQYLGGSSQPQKSINSEVEVFEDIELDDAPDLSPLPEIEMTYAKEFPSFFGQPK